MTSTAMTLSDLLADGFTERYAREYLDLLEKERACGLYDNDYLEWSHAHGFLTESACAYGLTEETYADYLTDYDCWKLWPANNWQRIWINDKLTLNALMQDSDLSTYIPEYYYYSSADSLLPLQGSGYAPGFDGFIETLRQKGVFACKPCNGTEASGFHMLAYKNGFFIDNVEADESDICAFLKQNPNYVFTEFIVPEASLAAINPLIHTIRVLVVNPTGINPTPILSYLRFAMEDGTTGNGANYVPPLAADIADFNVKLNLQTGEYGQGKLVYANRVVDSPKHPTSGTLAEGVIPHWSELMDMVHRISLKVGACEYLGFDACMTDQGPKIMEINSHSGVKYLQLFEPIWKNEPAAQYYRAKLQAIDELDDEGKKRRNAIVR